MADVREEVGPERLASFVETVLSDASRMVERLRQQPETASLPVIAQEAHRLKGSCRTPGFPRLAGVCEHIETLAGEEGGHDWLACAARLDTERQVVHVWQTGTKEVPRLH